MMSQESTNELTGLLESAKRLQEEVFDLVATIEELQKPNPDCIDGLNAPAAEE